MGSNPHLYCYEGSKSFVLLKWKIRVGAQLFCNSTILSYKLDGVSKNEAKDPLLKYKSNIGGTVVELLAQEGETVQPGDQLLKVQPCTHPVIMKDLCAECGTDLRDLDRDNFQKLTAAATFSMVHVVPELKVCLEQAEKLGRDDEDRLLKNRKLVLLVDLDQTLIHTTNDNVPKDLPDVHHFQLYGPNSPWYHTKLRPGTRVFLEKISKYYELHICTFGARLYAHKIAQILDSNGKLFSHRILSRDECFDATSKTANLKALFPRGDAMVCIIDDREDVWNFAPNVVHVKPYCYFHNTGDINAPPFFSSLSHTKDTLSTVKSELSTLDENKIKNEVNVNRDEKENENCIKNFENGADEKSEEVSVENENEKDGVTDSIIGDSRKIETAVNNKIDSGKKLDENNVSNIKSQNESVCQKQSIASEENSSQADETVTTSSKSDPIYELVPDDYLLYLEEILENIHKEYYKVYDSWKSKSKNEIPDLKIVIPKIRHKVLTGCSIVFSSVIPTNILPCNSRYWTLAESLGARVTLDLELDSGEYRTTHVVASKPGTVKVNAAKKHPGIFIVGLNWLFCCAERWERADERIFALKKESASFSDKNAQFEGSIENSFYDPTIGKSLKGWPGSKRSHNGSKRKSRKSKSEEEKFSERIFIEAGLSLSQDDIEDMDREVEEACSEESEKESESNSSSESSSEESLSSGDYPKGWKKPRRESDNPNDYIVEEGGESSDAETIGSVNEEMAEAVKQEFGS